MILLYDALFNLTVIFILWIVWFIVAIVLLFAGCLILYELLIMPIYEMICEYLEKKGKLKK